MSANSGSMDDLRDDIRERLDPGAAKLIVQWSDGQQNVFDVVAGDGRVFRTGGGFSFVTVDGRVVEGGPGLEWMLVKEPGDE